MPGRGGRSVTRSGSARNRSLTDEVPARSRSPVSRARTIVKLCLLYEYWLTQEIALITVIYF